MAEAPNTHKFITRLIDEARTPTNVKMESFVKIDKGLVLLSFVAELSNLDVYWVPDIVNWLS